MPYKTHLLPTRTNDGNRSAQLAGLTAQGLDLLDDLEGVGVSNLAEDDVLAVQPRGDDGGDEELRSVAIQLSVRCLHTIQLGKVRGRETYVLGPALAMDKRPGFSCFKAKFSSANFSP